MGKLAWRRRLKKNRFTLANVSTVVCLVNWRGQRPWEPCQVGLTLFLYQFNMDQRSYCKEWNFETTTGKNRITVAHVGIGNSFLTRSLVAQQLRERSDKWDHIKLNGFCTAKETVTRLKRQPTEWNFCQLYIWQGINNQNLQGAQSLISPKNEWSNEETNGQVKWTVIFQRNYKWPIKKIHIKTQIKISPHSSQNGYH
jgi:hypothetical protein